MPCFQSSSQINDIIRVCRVNGASAAKLCGAGGGGFVLCIVPEQFQKSFIDSISPLKSVKIEIDVNGTLVR